MTCASEKKSKKSKLEKICELSATLKVTQEENRLLRKELDALREMKSRCRTTTIPSAVLNADAINIEKMKDAVKALKQVTISQELSLNSMRSKAQERRQEIQEKDQIIAKLQRQVQRLQNAQHDIDERASDTKVRAKLRELQHELEEVETYNLQLQDALSEKDVIIKNLKRHSERPMLKRHSSNHSLMSIESASTHAEFDVVRIKKELAKKANKIVELEFQLESAKDTIAELQNKNKGPNEGFQKGTFDSFESDPFGIESLAEQEEDHYSCNDDDDDFW